MLLLLLLLLLALLLLLLLLLLPRRSVRFRLRRRLCRGFFHPFLLLLLLRWLEADRENFDEDRERITGESDDPAGP